MPADNRLPLIDRGSAGRKIGDFALVAFLLLCVSLGALASLPAGSLGERPVALIFPPWFDRSQAVSRSLDAGYSVMRTGRTESIVVAAPLPGGVLPRGAWLSIALKGLAGCLDAAAGELP